MEDVKTDPTFNSVRDVKVKPQTTVGTPGIVMYGGYLEDGEVDSTLRNTEKYRTYSNLLANVTIIATGVRFFLNLVAKASWTVEPTNNSRKAKKIAKELEYMMGDMQTPWHRIIRRAAMYRFYGFSIQEWTAKRNDNSNIAFLDIEPRPQITIERWDVDSSGTVLGVEQRNASDFSTVYIPRSKLVYLTDDTLNSSPEGLGLFRHLIKRATALERFEELEAYGYETDLRGIPIGRAPLAALDQMEANGEITRAQRAQIEAPLRNFLKKHIKNPRLALLLDSITYQSQDESGSPSNVPQWDIDLLKSDNGTAQAEVAAAIERLNRDIAVLLGIEGLLLGRTNGSYALSENKSENFSLIVDSTLKEIEETFEKDFVLPIFRLNGWDERLRPQLKTNKIQYRDIQSITGALKDMASAGAMLMPEDPAVMELRDMLGLPRPDILEIAEDDDRVATSRSDVNNMEDLKDDSDTGTDSGNK